MNANAGRNLKVFFITGLCLALLAAVIMPVMLAEQLQAISRAESLFAGNAALIGSSHALYGFPAPSIPARVTGAILFFAAAVTALLICINIIIWVWQAAERAKFPALGLLCYPFSYLRPDSLCHRAVCAEQEMP